MTFLYRDAALVAVDKPAGRIVIPGRGPPERTLKEEVEAELGARVWVVHRLDRGTSGVLLFALTAEAHRALNLAFEGRSVEKRYLAIVRGAPPAEQRIEAPIAPGRKGRMKVAAWGKPSATLVRLVEQRGPLALVECLPGTGRTHQIRVHLAHAGTPLAFDPDYGGHAPLTDREGRVVLARTPLHAASLALAHPATGAPLRVESPLPGDMRAALGLAAAGADL